MSKKKIWISLIIGAAFCGYAGAAVALAATVSEGTAPVAKEAVPDYYFFLILIFFALIVFQAVRLILTIIRFRKFKSKKLTAIIPYKVATLLPLAAIEGILVGEVAVFAALFFATRIIQRKIKDAR